MSEMIDSLRSVLKWINDENRKKRKKKEMIGKKANQEGNDFHVAGWF